MTPFLLTSYFRIHPITYVYFSKYWGTDVWAVPHLKFWGPSPSVPLSLRPWPLKKQEMISPFSMTVHSRLDDYRIWDWSPVTRIWLRHLRIGLQLSLFVSFLVCWDDLKNSEEYSCEIAMTLFSYTDKILNFYIKSTLLEGNKGVYAANFYFWHTA